MNTSTRFARLIGIVSLISLMAGTPTTKPAAPTSQPASQAMSSDQIHFTPPPDPWKFFEVKKPDTVYFQTPKGESAVQAIWAPKDFVLSADTDGTFAVNIMKDLKKHHEEQKVEMVLPPKIEKDARFDIVIHEKFKVSKDVTQDQTHYYKSVGPRVMMVTVSCVSDDQTVVDAARKAAEDLLVSCKFNRKAFKKD